MRSHRKGFRSRTFRKGFEAFRALAIAQCEVIGENTMNGWTAAEIMRRMEAVETRLRTELQH